VIFCVSKGDWRYSCAFDNVMFKQFLVYSFSDKLQMWYYYQGAFFKESGYGSASWSSLNKMLSLSFKCHCPSSGSVYICYANGFRFGSRLCNFCFGSSGCAFQFMGLVFLYFFQKFPNFSLQIYTLRFTFRV